MGRRSLGGWWPVAAWLAFPVVPVLLAQAYYQLLNLGGTDPRAWDLGSWVVMSGPLWGFGFLAGATVGLPDDPARRGVRAWLSRRAVWVAVGPWAGFILCAGAGYLYVERGRPTGQAAWDWLPGPVVYWGCLGACAFGWMGVAFAALRRARRLGRLGAAVRRGLVTALAFVGSLFGTFWAATEAWRGYFFDPTIARLAVLAVLGLTVMGGCGPVTVGEVRRRELFYAMLTAWVLGLALAWRWWARPRPRPPGR